MNRPSIYAQAIELLASKPVEPPRQWDIDQDVHTRHCCKTHGCKYGEDDRCTVQVTEHPGMTGNCQTCFDRTRFDDDDFIAASAKTWLKYRN